MTQTSVGRESRILEHMSQVEAIACRVFQQLPSFRKQTTLFDDLVGAGTLGLIAAVDSFDPSAGSQLRTFAQYKIRGAMLDWLRNQDWPPRQVRHRVKQIESAEFSLELKLKRYPTESELASELGLSVAEYRSWICDTRGANLLELDQEGDNVSPDAADPAEQLAKLERSELRHKLFLSMRQLPVVERDILTLHYINGLQGRQIAEQTALHESRVARLKKRAVARLRKALTEEGVKGGAKLDHFGGVKLDQLEMDPRVCFEFLWDGWNVA
jgi:RNA polymerase sigma factor for flagellar operon FliA